MYKSVYELFPFSYPSVISGYIGNTGALSYFDSFHKTYVSMVLPSTQFLSYCISLDDYTFYGVDENYTESSLYLFENVNISQKISNKDVQGAVFIRQHDSFLYIPGFASDNLWVINQPSFTTRVIVPTGPHPHGIYFYEDVFYVPCRGDVEHNDADFIYRYKNNDLSVVLDPINLGFIKKNAGPRHLAFVDNFVYIMTEFSCQIIRLDVKNFSSYKTVTMIDPITSDTTGAEILHHKHVIYSTLRIKNHPGHFIRYDMDLSETGRLMVGINPRFFKFNEWDYAVILNQDDQSFTIIDVNNWKIISTVTDLQIFPQCFIH